jgi:photosystem II stability/assembly factor-like uncharacterized protein
MPAAAKKPAPKKAAPAKKAAPRRAAAKAPARRTLKARTVTLLVGTRKGAWTFTSDATRTRWRQSDPMFLGQIVHHFVLDPRDGETLLAAVRTGHLGPTVFRSTDGGRTWHEAAAPPRFAKARDGEKGRSVEHVFWLRPGHASQPGVWWCGTSPLGLFRSEDGGQHWEEVRGLASDPRFPEWEKMEAPPGGQILHSIQIDPRDAAHMYFCMSVGGVFETKDGGASWSYLNKGLMAEYMPDPYPEFGHDPHCMAMSPADPDILWQQNHCGIYRIDRKKGEWTRVGRNMPKAVGDIGFPVVLHPRDEKRAWVFPMDGTDVWPRISPGGRCAVYHTRDAGKTWQEQRRGLPSGQAWLTVLRTAMCCDHGEPVGLYFGTTGGDIFASRTEGASWSNIARHLPTVFSVEVAGCLR